jgi:glyoxylase-like metal-dependent hydrolase (beta-lactamase superfamily II)
MNELNPNFISKEIFGTIFKNDLVTIQQLIVGYSDSDSGEACGSVSLIYFKHYQILVDCGLPTTDLRRESPVEFNPSKIDYVIVTHWHSDHCGRLYEFTNARKILPDDIKHHEIENAGPYLELLKFSGHSLSDLVLIVRPDLETDELIVIAGLLRSNRTITYLFLGDLFENLDDYLSPQPAVSGLDPQKLLSSRQEIYKLNPTIVIPGHGAAFRLRPTISLTQERHFGEVILRTLLSSTPQHDQVWLISYKTCRILINTRETDLLDQLNG